MHCTQLLEHESKLISIGYNKSLNDRQLHLVVKNITKESGIGIESKFQSDSPSPLRYTIYMFFNLPECWPEWAWKNPRQYRPRDETQFLQGFPPKPDI